MRHTYCASQDLFNIAPKRPNWDLKRELDKKLSKLERKTQESIHTLIRASPPTPHLPPKLHPKANVVIVARTGRRLAAQKGESDDIVGAMKAQERAGVNDDSSDEED